jgi:hypothetical protein
MMIIIKTEVPILYTAVCLTFIKTQTKCVGDQRNNNPLASQHMFLTKQSDYFVFMTHSHLTNALKIYNDMTQFGYMY